MNHVTCPQSSLVEALRDGRLGPPERASIERHLATCRACATLATDLARIGAAVAGGGASPTPLDHQRARQALLRRAAGEPAAPARRVWVWALAACVSALVPAAVWTFTKTPAPLAQVPATRASEARVTPSPNAGYERARVGSDDQVSLTNGTIDIAAIDAADVRLTVKTSDAVIVVAGAASLRVEAEQGRLVSLAVREGEVRLVQAEVAVIIPAGGSWSVSRAVAAMAAPSASTVPSASATATPATPPARPRVAPRVVTSARAPSEAVDQAVAPSASSSASRAFADAMDAVARGDFASGAERLGAFSSAHPDDARADDAEYLKAIALARAGRADDAAAAARRYLATRPRGAHRAQIQKLVAP